VYKVLVTIAKISSLFHSFSKNHHNQNQKSLLKIKVLHTQQSNLLICGKKLYNSGKVG
jgi:hypothetical protein